MAPRESPRLRPRERAHHHDRRSHGQSPRKSRDHATSSDSSSQDLSADSLAKLDQLNQYTARQEVTPKKERRKRHREVIDEKIVVERSRRQDKRRKRRVVSGALLEEGDGQRLTGRRGGIRNEKEYEYNDGNRKKRLCTLPSRTSIEFGTDV